MFDTDFFEEKEDAGPGRAGVLVGMGGLWLLHIAKIAFLIYSGYHGISATAAYRGGGQLAAAAGMVGIVVVEVVLFALYLAWHNQRITGTAQSLAAAITYAIGFVLACMGIVADSQLNAGMGLSPWLAAYVGWGLPVAPAVMALGALLTHELDPRQLHGRKKAAELAAWAEERFSAHMAAERASMEQKKLLANMQLNAKAAAAKQIAQWYSSDQAQKAITAAAMQNAPALLRAIGVDVDAVDSDRNGRIDANELAAWAQANPGAARRLLAMADDGDDEDAAVTGGIDGLDALVDILVEERLQQREPVIVSPFPSPSSHNGNGANFTRRP